MQDMEKYFLNVAEKNAELEVKWTKIQEKAEEDFRKINERYEEFYQNIPRNIKIESEAATLRIAKTINNVELNRVMNNILEEKTEEELQEIGGRPGISQDDVNPEESFHDTEFNHSDSDKKVGYTSVFEGDTYSANEPHSCINAEYAAQMQNAENSLQEIGGRPGISQDDVNPEESFHDTEFNHSDSDKKVGYTSVFEGDTYSANEPHSCINVEYAAQMQNAENSLQEIIDNEVETDEFYESFPGESVEEENQNKKKGSFFGLGRILKR